MNACKEKAYAKINLYLDCVDKRSDGFHSIKSVMHSLSLSDEVTVVLNGTGKRSIRIVLEGNRRLPVDNKNLCYLAAERFMERACLDLDITIKLDKKIPIAAGLAGGSSDAAATLRALNRLCGRTFTERVLLDIALSVGSDVPYCLVGGTMLCEGRGEILTRLENVRSFYTVVAIGDDRVSTPHAYGRLDEIYNSFDGSVKTGGADAYPELIDYLVGKALPKRLFNVFETAVFPIAESASCLKAKMLELGASLSLMSGSGPSVFGIFDTEEKAKAAEAELLALGVRAYFATSV